MRHRLFLMSGTFKLGEGKKIQKGDSNVTQLGQLDNCSLNSLGYVCWYPFYLSLALEMYTFGTVVNVMQVKDFFFANRAS